MPAINTFPWEEGFGTAAAWLPTFWQLSNSIYPEYGSTSGSTWVRGRWLNATYNAAKFAYHSTPAKAGWLVTPPIEIPATAHELKFDLALTAYNSAEQYVDDMHESQIFRVVMSDTPTMDNPIILREWNSTDSPYAITGISHLGEEVVIPLAGITGVKFFAFYAETLQKLASPSAPDIYVDNVGVRLSPVIYPIAPDVDVTLAPNTTAVISPTGGATLAGAYEDDSAILTAIPNSNFVPAYHKVWRIIGDGMINLTISTLEDWFAYMVGGDWFAQEVVPGVDIIVPINLGAKDGSFEFALGGGGHPTLPVELSYFNAVFVAENNSVNLSWKTESESQMLGYYIYRSMDENLSDATIISSLIHATNTSAAHSYSFIDNTLLGEGVYYYWLNTIEINGHDSFHGPVTFEYNLFDDEGEQVIPFTTRLKGVYPNPFNPNTNIGFELSEKSEIKISIYNVRGQMVRNYPSKTYEAGHGSVAWDGKDDSGNAVSSGVYHIRMITGKKSFSTKAVLMK